MDLLWLFWRLVRFMALRSAAYFVAGGAVTGGLWNALLAIDVLFEAFGARGGIMDHNPDRMMALGVLTGVFLSAIGGVHGALRAIAPKGIPRDAVW